MMLFHNIDTYYMADVIAIWETLVHILFLQADVIAFYFSFYWQMLLPIVSGRCYTT